MLRAIAVGSCVTIQGKLIQKLDDGRIAIRVGSKVYHGRPLQ